MNDTDRPDLSLGALTQIADDLFEMDKDLWEALRPMLMPKSINENTRFSGPRPPKLSPKFYLILSNFSREVFLREASSYPRYPPNPNFSNWLRNLAQRTEDHTISVVQDIEDSDSERSFAYHGVIDDEMRKTIKKALRAEMELRYDFEPIKVLPAPLQPPQVREQTARPGIRSDQTEVERRATLLSAYKLATGAKEYHIYTAQNSGIHKPQFYQWRDGRLPANSRIAKRFENFLKAQRKPIRKISTN